MAMQQGNLALVPLQNVPPQTHPDSPRDASPQQKVQHAVTHPEMTVQLRQSCGGSPRDSQPRAVLALPPPPSFEPLESEGPEGWAEGEQREWFTPPPEVKGENWEQGPEGSRLGRSPFVGGGPSPPAQSGTVCKVGG